MGSVAKHMNHPYDDLDLRIGDLLGMIKAISGGLIEAVEKFDGINMHWTEHRDLIRYARNFEDVGKGGCNLVEMCGRYHSHPARSQFVNGLTAIYNSTRNINWTLPTDGTFWINCEIVDSNHQQTIPYDKSAIVWHQLSRPNAKNNGMEMVVGTQNTAFVGMLKTSMVSEAEEEWMVVPPTLVDLPDKSDNDVTTKAILMVENLRESLGLNNLNTVGDIIRRRTENYLNKFTDNQLFIDAVIKKVMRDDGHKTILKLRKMIHLTENQKKMLDDIALSKNIAKWHKDCLTDLRLMWLEFGAMMLSETVSCLITEPDDARDHLKRLMDWSVKTTEEEDRTIQKKHVSELRSHMKDFKSLNVDPPLIEGVVFLWHDKKYKMTGAFASMNRVLGVPRYCLGIAYDKNKK